MIIKPISVDLSAACSCDLVIAGTIAMGVLGVACIIFVCWRALIGSNEDGRDFNWEMEEDR